MYLQNECSSGHSCVYTISSQDPPENLRFGKDFMQPDVSVVVPVHERLTGVDLAIESIPAQTAGVREVIVVDDGSPKEIGKRIQELIAERPAWRERVCYVRQENKWQSAVRNSGIIDDGGIRSADHETPELWWKIPGTRSADQ